MGLLDFIKKKADEGSRVVRGAYAQLNPFDDNRTFKTTWHNAQPVDNDVDNTARIQSNAINRWTQDYRSGKIDRNRYDALMRSVDSRGDMYGISKPIQDQYRAGTIDENRYQDLLNTLGQKQAPQAEKINPLVRVVAPNALGGGRSILGMAQGASGLYDLLTPGTGENRFSQYLDQKAKATDQLIDDTGLSKLAYRGSQAALDLASLATVPAKLGMNTKTAKAAGLLDDANLFEKGIYGLNTGVGKLAPAVETGITKLGMPTFGKAIGYGVKEGLTGRDIIQDAIFNAKQFGEMSGKGQAITPTDIAMNVGGTLIGNPILSGAGGVVTDNLLAPVAKTLASGSGKVLVNSAEKSVDAGKKAVETGRKAVKVTKDLNVKYNPNIDAEAGQLMNSIEQGEKELAKTPDGPKRRALLKNLADLDKQLSDTASRLQDSDNKVYNNGILQERLRREAPGQLELFEGGAQEVGDNRLLTGNNLPAARNRAGFEQKGWKDIRGEDVTKGGKDSPEKIAQLLKDYRNPAKEYTQYVYVKDGKVVAHNTTTLDHHAASSASPRETAFGIQNRMKRLGADKVYVSHNHPSGTLQFSDGDRSVTSNLHNKLGDKFGGHILTDHDGIAVDRLGYGPSSETKKTIDLGKKYAQDGVSVNDRAMATELITNHFDPVKNKDMVGMFVLDTQNRPIAMEKFRPKRVKGTESPIDTIKTNKTLQQLLRKHRGSNYILALGDNIEKAPMRTMDALDTFKKEVSMFNPLEKPGYVLPKTNYTAKEKAYLRKHGKASFVNEPDVKVANKKALEQSILNSAQKPVKVKDTSINAGETLDKLKARQKTPAQIIAEQYGGKVDDVQRNIDRYGLEQTEKHYNLASSSGQAKNIDAVATSELKKTTKPVKVVDTKANSTEVDLKQEALKYKTPEEFVNHNKETPKTVRVFIKSKFSDGGGYADVPVIRKEENITLYQGGTGEGRQFWTSNENYAKRFGNGEITKKTGTFYQIDNGNRMTDVYVDANRQLTDLYNQAHAEAKTPSKPKATVKPSIAPDVQEAADAANSTVKITKNNVVEPVLTKPIVEPTAKSVTTEPPAKLNKDINRPSNVDGTTGEIKSIPEQIRSLPDENKLDSKAVAQIESTRDNLYNYADEVHVGLGDETVTKMADDILNARGDISKIPQSSKDLYDKHFREMFEELGAIRKSEGGTIKDYYFPETFDAKGKLVDTGWGHMAEDNTVFGSNKARKGKMTTETVADTNSRIKNYVDQVLFDKYGNTKQFQVERWTNKLQDQAKKSGKELALDKAVKASEMIVDLQNEIKEQVRKISFFGLGRQKNVVDSQKVAGMYLGGKELDIAGRFNQISREIGDDVDTLNARARGITSITKVDGVDYHGKRLSDHLGMTQFRDSSAFASTQVESGDDLLKVASDYINKNYDIDKHTKQTLFREVSNINNDIPDEIRKAKLASIYRQASVEQLTKNLGKIDIANPTLRKHVNKLADTMLSEQYIRNATSTKVVRKMLQVQNAIFRKLNIGSAINELSDLNAMTAIFGKDMVAGLKYNADKLKEYNIIASQLDPAGAKLLNSVADGKELSSILSARFKSGAKKINDLTNIYHLVETYKASIAIQAAEKLHLSKLESGAITKDEFTKLVLKDFREATLPVDQFTKTALDSFPQYTQYLTWQARNMGKEWNLLTGNLDAGILSDMGKRERVIRNAYTNLPAKTAFWLASNGLKGTAILTAFGLTDFTGMSDQDFSGIEEKDKSNYDKYLAKYANMSTTLGLISDIYQDFEKARLDKQYQERNEEYNPYKGGSIGNRVATTLREQRGTPQFIKNAFGNVSNPSSKDDGMLGLMKKGYSENSSGKVQYLAPTNPADIARGFIFGKRNTHAGKEYSGTSSIATRVGRGENPIVAVKDMALEQVNRQETKYNRPLSNSVNASYSDAVKSLKGAEQKAMFDKGREYNKKLDDLRRNNPDAYKAYIGSLDKDKVNPEMWRERVMRNGKFDETVFNVLKARNQQAAKDFGKEVPPIYRDDLTKEQVKTILQQKSVATGEDTELSSRLWKEKWYADYKNREVEYYKKNPSEFDDSKKTQRVKDWNSLEARRNDLKQLADDKGNIKEWTKRYPLVAERQAIQDKYGYDSSERKAWDRANYDSYKAQKAGYDEEELAIVNGMRKIEGIEPISMARFKPESTTASKSSGGSGGSGRDSSRGSSGFFNYAKYYDGISSGKTGSIKVKANLGNKVNIKRRSGKVTVAKTSRQKARM